MRRTFVSLCGALLALAFGTAVQAQPLVTGDLSVYYSFDELTEDGLWLDGSGNELHGLTVLGEFDDDLDDGLDDISLDSGDKVRGAGSAWFNTEPDFKDDYIAVCDPLYNPDHNEGCGEPLEDRPDYVPSTAFSFAAWVKVEETGTDQAIWQSRAGGGGFLHTQVQGNGNVRMQLRGDLNSDNIAGFNEPVNDGNPVEFGEWMHIAGTYDKGPVAEDFGVFALYYNGELVVEAEANGDVAGTEFETLGDWAQGGFVGLVPDLARQFVGRMDEFYLFTRAITAEEVQTLYGLEDPFTPGDYNQNGVLDAADLNLQAAEIGGNNAAFDLNSDGSVDFDDRLAWVKDLKNTWVGDSNLDGEFNSGDFVQVFTAGLFESGAAATWEQGDWNGDGKFDSGDFVSAFTDGGFELGPRTGVSAVPEPTSLGWLASLGVLMTLRRRR